MKIILFACCWSVLVISSVAQTPEIRGKALLVGINHYRDADVPGTLGCVEDAQQTAEFIKSKYGFPASSIKLLLNEQATAANIQKTFREWLIEGTRPGERVFFLYSGHDSQLPDDNGDEADGLDETIAPFDVELKTGANQIRDDRFEEFTMQLSGRLVVMIFDSCHSGTISRSLNAIGANKKMWERVIFRVPIRSLNGCKQRVDHAMATAGLRLKGTKIPRIISRLLTKEKPATWPALW